MEETLYHVLLEDRRLGPFDRRTIVGMRVKKALTSGHVLESSDGAQLTVAELVRGSPAPEPPPPAEPVSFDGSRSGSYSVVQAVHTADLLDVQGTGHPVPPFRGEVEVRAQTKALRIAGRFRDGLVWKEDRVKFPLQDILHARLQGSIVELGIRPPQGDGLQRLRLDLRTPDAARELVELLPHTLPWPGSEPLAGRPAERTIAPMLVWLALAGTAVAVIGVLAWVLVHRA